MLIVCSNEGPGLYLRNSENILIQKSSSLEHWTNFKQTWQKAALVEEDLSFFKLKGHTFLKTKLCTKHSWMKGTQVCLKPKWAFIWSPVVRRLSVCPSVRPSVRPSVCVSVNFSHFHLLVQNHKANFNQIWHKASYSENTFKKSKISYAWPK